MMQDRLFFEDWREALRHVVAAMGGPKVVGARMRQDMKPDHLFLLLRLAREAGVHAGKSMESLVKRIEDMESRSSRMAAVK